MDCEAVNTSTAVGVRVHILSENRVQYGSRSGGESEELYFGTDSTTRKDAFESCREVLNATRCVGIEPTAWDQNVNVGDPGFGPRYTVRKSTRAGVFKAGEVSNEVRAIVGRSLSEKHDQYFTFFSDCQEARVTLALDLLKTMQRQWLRAHSVQHHSTDAPRPSTWGTIKAEGKL
jgi:hypothetical protein